MTCVMETELYLYNRHFINVAIHILKTIFTFVRGSVTGYIFTALNTQLMSVKE